MTYEKANPIPLLDARNLYKQLINGEISMEYFNEMTIGVSHKRGAFGIDFPMTGSMAPKILGVSKYGGKKGVFAKFYNEAFEEIREEAGPLEVGHIEEDPTRELFNLVNKDGVIAKPANITVGNPNWPNCIANIDGLIYEGDNLYPTGIYEGKILYDYKSQHALDVFAGIVPQDYLMQIQFYMEMWNLNFTYICFRTGMKTTDIKYFRVERDHDLGTMICQELENFAEACKLGIMPDNSNVQELEALLSDARAVYTYGDSSLPKVTIPKDKASIIKSCESLSERIKEIKEATKDLDQEKRKLEKEIKQELGVFADILGNATLGELTDDDGNTWIIEYPEAEISFNAKVKKIIFDYVPKEELNNLLKEYPKERSIKYSKKSIIA